ncbi:DNA ligase D [Legionella sp. CNM-1927-20]|uniref:DNA ligase D n=1 Tax=Legionella sp. CNM-1927-20 TaxID=3422221 RepID=UPI00403B02A3
MSLKTYHEKRDFNKTTEPKGKVQHTHKNLFIIQKHAASHLHYDFRLELEGVLKSWAVPKGPSLDPTVKRLAMQVEDHPVEYGSFEGIIPEGEYGGGTVMLWDKGKWRSLDDNPKAAYEKGHLRFELNAEKLKGRWDLIKSNRDKKVWFLIKFKDKEAKPLAEYDITEAEPNSVLTDQTLEEITENYTYSWDKKGLKKAPKIRKSEIAKQLASALSENKAKSSFPEIISPELATLVDDIPEGPDWLHEIKFDGYRIIAFKDGNTIRLMSRNNKDWTGNFSNIVAELKKLPVKRAIFDGEIVVLDEQHKSNFQLLQNSVKANKQTPFIYYIFDLLYVEKLDLREKPLLERKTTLAKVLESSNKQILRFSEHIIDQGEAVLRQSCALALEGIISKKVNSPYLEKRTEDWVKVKCVKRQEFVIGGYTLPKGERHYFGSLLVGFYDKQGQLHYCGNVGTGFTQASLKSVFSELEKNRTTKNPFNSRPPVASKALWVKPILVAEVEFTEWTKDERLRHPSFQGLRYDKDACSVGKEIEVPIKEVNQSTTNHAKKTKKKQNPVVLTHADKIIYSEDKITKGELFNYYEEISEHILPYIENRLLTLVRCPKNYSKCFYQKHLYANNSPALYSLAVEGKTETEQYLYLKDQQGLLSLIQMGVLEIHPWGSQIESLEYPDTITIDLDPAPDVLWKEVVQAAWEIKKYLAEVKLACFVKTTGGKGLHVVVPILPEYDWEDVKQFTEVFVQFLEKLRPEAYVSKMTKAKRRGKIFIDYLRNQRSATAISAYSTRARLHAPVATPLDWDELTNNFNDTFYTIRTLPKRLKELTSDPWQEFRKVKQSLKLDALRS